MGIGSSGSVGALRAWGFRPIPQPGGHLPDPPLSVSPIMREGLGGCPARWGAGLAPFAKRQPEPPDDRADNQAPPALCDLHT